LPYKEAIKKRQNQARLKAGRKTAGFRFLSDTRGGSPKDDQTSGLTRTGLCRSSISIQQLVTAQQRIDAFVVFL
jgi:hypothetical protein